MYQVFTFAAFGHRQPPASDLPHDTRSHHSPFLSSGLGGTLVLVEVCVSHIPLCRSWLTRISSLYQASDAADTISSPFPSFLLHPCSLVSGNLASLGACVASAPVCRTCFYWSASSPNNHNLRIICPLHNFRTPSFFSPPINSRLVT